MMRHLNVLLALSLVTLLTGIAQAEILLFQKVINVNRSENIFDADQFDLDLIFGDDFFDPNNGVTLFDSLVISPQNIGDTFNATSASDPNNFPTVADRITDGLDEFISYTLTEVQVGGITEKRGGNERFFFGHPTPPGPPDLAGSTVDRVSLYLSTFVLLPIAPAGGPASAVEGQPFDVVLTVSIYSAIPEPAAVGLLLVGWVALGLAPFRRARRATGAPVV